MPKNNCLFQVRWLEHEWFKHWIWEKMTVLQHAIIDRQTGRQTDRETDRHRQTDRQGGRERVSERERELYNKDVSLSIFFIKLFKSNHI